MRQRGVAQALLVVLKVLFVMKKFAKNETDIKNKEGLSASRLPACPAVYRIFKGGAKIFTVYA